MIGSCFYQIAQLGEPPDNSIRLHGMPCWQASASEVDPDPVDALSLRLRDVPLEIIANHPGVTRGNTQRIKRSRVHTRVGFTEPELTLDENQIEQIGQAESIDFIPLHVAAAVGQQRQATTARPQPCDGINRIRKRLQPSVTQVVIQVANPPGQARVVDPNLVQCDLHDLTSGSREIETAHTVALWIGPVPLSDAFDGVVDRDRITPAHRRLVRVAGREPAGGHAPAIVQDRVVEIEQNSLGTLSQDDKCTHTPPCKT
jgi:hypothetical protein